jgi:two-component system, NarL family, sensor histidine kinase FusK
VSGAAFAARVSLGRRDLSALPYLAKVAGICAVYYGAAKFGLTLAVAHSSVTAVWPPTGIALAVVLMWGNRYWPGVALGAFLANSWTGVPLVTVAGIATGNTLEALVGAHLLRRVGFRPSLERAKDVLVLFGLAGVVSTAVSATFGVASLWIGGVIPSSDLVDPWRVWWLGDMGGDLLVAPALLVFAGGLGLSSRLSRIAEGTALLGMAVAVPVFIFSHHVPFGYLVFPVVIWAALRFSQRGATAASLMVAAVAVWFTSKGTGLFQQGSPDDNLLLAQTFAGVTAMTALLLAAVSSERRRAERALRAANDELEATVRERTAELRRSNTELSRSVGELEQFGHVISHDLSEPLRAIAGFAELLSDRYRGRLDGRADGYIHHVVNGATRMKALIDALLAYSQAGEKGINPAEVSCGVLLRDATDALSKMIEEASATVTADPLPTVRADPVLLGEVFQNLLSNAVKFSNGGGCRVHVSAERENGGWRLSFRDHGIGIEPRHADRVFDVFNRVHARDEYPGAGIGLAICRKIVESHGGEIGAQLAPGGGSILSFTLPDSAES